MTAHTNFNDGCIQFGSVLPSRGNNRYLEENARGPMPIRSSGVVLRQRGTAETLTLLQFLFWAWLPAESGRPFGTVSSKSTCRSCSSRRHQRTFAVVSQQPPPPPLAAPQREAARLNTYKHGSEKRECVVCCAACTFATSFVCCQFVV